MNTSADAGMDRIKFTVNGFDYSVGSEVSSSTSLLQFLRNKLELRGTKYMCLEGGCGACVVAVTKYPGVPIQAVNSCLVSITSCQDWEITTIEKVGNRLEGYHPVQTTLALFNGTQCGYCSPGMVMSMYSLLKSKGKLSMLQIEQSLGSNICRCTGYRPILEAFKTFAGDSPNPNDIMDIEDLKICDRTGKACAKTCNDDDWCLVTLDDVKQPSVISIKLSDNKEWYRVQDTRDIFHILRSKGDDSYMLVNGNTAKGVFPIDEYPRVLIDISGVTSLKSYYIDQNLVIGAGMTLSDMMETFEKISNTDNFGYLKVLNEHLKLVAHIVVKNLGSVAGNLMIKHKHNDFPSDLFLLFETIGAQVTIQNNIGIRKTVTMVAFLKENMRDKVILNLLLPPLSKEYKIVSYKIMPRAQNARAMVNAGLLCKLVQDTVKQCRLVFGGISPTFNRAENTERFLLGKKLFTNETLQGAVKILDRELVVVDAPLAASAKYRKKLAIGLFYKALLSLCPSDVLSPQYRSGATDLHRTRPVSHSQQTFDTNSSLWPLNQPIPKVDGLMQCAGEASYTEDIPSLPREVFATFVLSTVPLGKIENIDASKALAIPGVIAFYTAKDIPGVNTFIPGGSAISLNNEVIVCDGDVKYYNQPIGIIVAKSQKIAESAANLVTVQYSNIKKPVIDLNAAISDPKRVTLVVEDTATDTGTDVVKVIKGSNSIYGQYHFCMETLTCVSRPTEEGIEVHATTQWMDGVQFMSSIALNIPQNKLDVHVRRLGGGYGFKLTRANQVAIACNLVVQKLNRPCRFIQSLRTNMRAFGKRLPAVRNFEVGVDKNGEIQYINSDMYEDNGYIVAELLITFASDTYYNCYIKSRWNYKAYNVVTDTASNTWCRSPGTLESITMSELVMEQISYEMSLDPIQVRLANLDTDNHDAIREMIEKLKIDADYTTRRAAVDKYNKENRWKKRGLRLSCMRWTAMTLPLYYDISLSVYHGDGTVAITHSGIEIGQGINTKAVQICAYYLKIPIEKVQVKSNNTTQCPNDFATGNSTSSQSIGIGIVRCCEEMLKRLEPIRAQMDNPTWEELISKAYDSGIDLQTHGFVNLNDNQQYNVYGVAIGEVEIDVLTGECEILRVDLSEDVGRSVSPGIDIGQIEGAFIMGIGYWTCEQLVYEKSTGQLLSDRTWEYWVPQARDIPQDFRVYFRKGSYSNDVIQGSKATGEPAICLSLVVALAMREAIAAARSDSGIPTTQWFQLDGPHTIEKVCLATASKIDDFKFN